jgi:hypothetical protein
MVGFAVGEANFANNDDAFDETYDTFHIDMANNDDAFDDLYDTWHMSGDA